MQKNFFNVHLFIFERKKEIVGEEQRERERERGRERIPSRLHTVDAELEPTNHESMT